MSAAREELTSWWRGEELDGVLADTVVELLLSRYGHCEWPILRDAALALARRFHSARDEGLKVWKRAASTPRLEPFEIISSDGVRRPHQTQIYGVNPLRTSCSCMDFRVSSLGLCKHGVAALRWLSKSKQRWRKLAIELGQGALVPALSWDPVRPIDGEGDWLARLEIRTGPKNLARLGLELLEASVDPSAALLYVPRERVRRDTALRHRLLVAVRTFASRSPRDVEPALVELVMDELQRLSFVRDHRVPSDRLALEKRIAALKIDLYPYQVTAVKTFVNTGRMLLADDMGLGKTIQTAAIADVLWHRRQARRILIVAPASLKSQWVREWRRVTDVPIQAVEGSQETRRLIYDSTNEGALVCNYEQVHRDLSLMAVWRAGLTVLDEAQRVKNWETRTAKTVKQLPSRYRLALTGTPLENRIEELASIMDWVDPMALAPKWRLTAAHSIVGDGARESLGVQRLDTLRTRLQPSMLRRRRAEILSELPSRTDVTRTLEMTNAQRGLHDALSPDIAKIISRTARRSLTRPEFLRLMSLLTTQRVIANGVCQLEHDATWAHFQGRPYDAEAVAALSMPKLDVVRELVESVVVDQGRKMVLFSQWRRGLIWSGWAIRDILERAGLRAAFFTGAESQQRRTQNVIEFHDDPRLRVLLCTDAGGVGLNLQRAASCCVHLELPWNPAVFEQRVARLHRLGQPEPVDVFSLVSEPSIESRIAGALTNKRAVFSALFDGHEDSVVFESAGGFLAAVRELAETEVSPSAAHEPQDAELDDMLDESESRADNLELAIPLEHSVVADEALTVSLEAAVDEPMAFVQRPEDAERDGDPVGQATGNHDRTGETGSPDHTWPTAARDVAALMSTVRVETTSNGTLRLEAPPEAAQALVALFTGMAQLLAQTHAPRSPSPPVEGATPGA